MYVIGDENSTWHLTTVQWTVIIEHPHRMGWLKCKGLKEHLQNCMLIALYLTRKTLSACLLSKISDIGSRHWVSGRLLTRKNASVCPSHTALLAADATLWKITVVLFYSSKTSFIGILKPNLWIHQARRLQETYPGFRRFKRAGCSTVLLILLYQDNTGCMLSSNTCICMTAYRFSGVQCKSSVWLSGAFGG